HTSQPHRQIGSCYWMRFFSLNFKIIKIKNFPAKGNLSVRAPAAGPWSGKPWCACGDGLQNWWPKCPLIPSSSHRGLLSGRERESGREEANPNRRHSRCLLRPSHFCLGLVTRPESAAAE